MANNYSSFLDMTDSIVPSTKTQEQNTQSTDIFWVKRGGIATPKFADEIHYVHSLCNVREMSNWVTELLNSREAVEVGKESVSVSEGIRASATMTFKGGASLELAAMLGQHAHNINGATTGSEYSPVVSAGSYGVQGHIIVLNSYRESGSSRQYLQSCTLIRSVEIDVLEVAGVSNSGEATYNVTLSTIKEPLTVEKGFVFVPFIFYDDGSNITNSNASDGSTTAFAVKNANGAFASIPSDNFAFQVVNHDLNGTSNPYEFIAHLELDGVEQSSSAFTVTASTNTITFNTAPADGVKLEGICLMRTGVPTYESDKQYFPGDVVLHSGSYYQKKTETDTDPTTTADWTALSGVSYAAPYFSSFPGTNFDASAHREHALYSWRDFQDPII